MYGIVIEGVRYMIEDHFGTSTWSLVLEKMHMVSATFSTHDRYSEKIIPDMLTALAEITGQSAEEIGILTGRYFVRFMMQYGHGELLKVLGRRFSDFLKALDELHAYFRFSYPRIRAPSFYCDKETAEGVTLHYRSRRQGYISYVMGQLLETAEVFYQTNINIEVLRKEEKKNFQYVLMRVKFDNHGYFEDQNLRERNTALNEFLPVDSMSVLSMFPYFIAFNKKLEVVVVGQAMHHVLPGLKKKRMDKEFELMRPVVKFTWDACLHHLNNLFEFKSVRAIEKKVSDASIAFIINDTIEDKVKVPTTTGQVSQAEENLEDIIEDDEDQPVYPGAHLNLRGPIIYLKHSDIIVYLPSVMIETLDTLFDVGLYLNDYSVSDCNREIIMASVQKSNDLKDLLKREKEKSKTLSKNMKEIDESRKKAKELLSSMMPPEVANEMLTSDKKTLTICESFEHVTLAFAKVLNFNEMTNKLPPMEVVSFLNNVYSTFDHVIEKNGVYKVETVGESYMISCGVPYETTYHSEYIADTMLDMINEIAAVSETLIPGNLVQIKIGAHSGPCVGGVVGLRAPRYCLFGDTVNCASRLESHNKTPMTIQISVNTKVTLESVAPNLFVFESRGKVNLKGKGEMLTFAILSKKGPPRCIANPLKKEANDDSEKSDAYTVIDDHSERESSMSRMSISITGSRVGSRSGSRASDIDHSERSITDNVSPIPEDDIPIKYDEPEKKKKGAKQTEPQEEKKKIGPKDPEKSKKIGPPQPEEQKKTIGPPQPEEPKKTIGPPQPVEPKKTIGPPKPSEPKKIIGPQRIEEQNKIGPQETEEINPMKLDLDEVRKIGQQATEPAKKTEPVKKSEPAKKAVQPEPEKVVHHKPDEVTPVKPSEPEEKKKKRIRDDPEEVKKKFGVGSTLDSTGASHLTISNAKMGAFEKPPVKVIKSDDGSNKSEEDKSKSTASASLIEERQPKPATPEAKVISPPKPKEVKTAKLGNKVDPNTKPVAVEEKTEVAKMDKPENGKILTQQPKKNGIISLPKSDRVKSDDVIKKDVQEVLDNANKVHRIEKQPLPPIDKTIITDEEVNSILGGGTDSVVTLNGYVAGVQERIVQTECMCGSFVERQIMKTKVCSIM